MMRAIINSSKVGRSPLFVLIILLIFTASCKKDKGQNLEAEYRNIAWNYLSENARATVVSDWKAAPITFETRDNQELAVVMFNTTQDALLGPIFVYISIKTKTATGIGPRF